MAKEQKSENISSKSKKNEILEAYNELLEKVKTESSDPQELKTMQETKTIVSKAAGLTSDNINKKFVDLKLSMSNELSTLEQKILDEYSKFKNLQQAIEIETNNLEEFYEIKKNADTLAALILAQKEYRAKFEIEKQELEKERERDTEEYRYNLQLERRKENDEYEEKKIELEKALKEKKVLFEKTISERQNILDAKEEEFNELREKVAKFESILEEAIKKTEKETREAIETKYKYQIDLNNKEIEGERKLNQQVVASLKDKIKEQDTFIIELSQRANDSTKQVQSIALKALEGSSYRTANFENRKNNI